MKFGYELSCRPDVNKRYSYVLRFPKWTSLAELIYYVVNESGNYTVSIKGKAFEKNHVLVEKNNNGWYIRDKDTIRKLCRRFCNKVTVYSGGGTLEYAVELKKKKAMTELINFMLKKSHLRSKA